MPPLTLVLLPYAASSFALRFTKTGGESMAVETEPIGDGDAKDEERWSADEVPLCWRCDTQEGWVRVCVCVCVWGGGTWFHR